MQVVLHVLPYITVDYMCSNIENNITTEVKNAALSDHEADLSQVFRLQRSIRKVRLSTKKIYDRFSQLHSCEVYIHM